MQLGEFGTDRAQESLEHPGAACACPRRDRSRILPDAVRSCVELIIGQIDDLQTRVQTNRKGHSSNPPGQRGQPAAADDPRHRRDHGIRNYCHH